MLKVLKEGKVPVLRFDCTTRCDAVFIASLDECDEKVIMGVPIYQALCPCCTNWVSGTDTGLTADQKEEIEKLEKDILKEIQLEESLPEETDV